MRLRPAFATLSLVALVGMPAFGQSREDRVNQIAATLSAGISDKPSDTVYTDARTGEEIRATPAQLMRETLTSVNLDAVPGRLALDIWSNQTNVPLVVSWASLEAQGIDPQQPVTLTLGRVPAELALKLIIQQLHPDPIGNDELLVDIEQWYVRIMTKEDALRRSTTRVYFIGDLLMDIPNFDNAPGFDLNDALSNTSSGGSGRGSGSGGNQDQGLFGDDSDEEKEEVLSKEEKAERIADMVRNTVEPDIWRANGGEYGSVRYYRGMLVVKAPDFVHEQIGGIAGGTTTKSTSKRKNTSRSSDGNNQDASPAIRRSTPGNVAGVARDRPPIPRSR
ncbi:MAG: hypothetical protein AAGB26_02680 [Planctomycetota bacterium]